VWSRSGQCAPGGAWKIGDKAALLDGQLPVAAEHCAPSNGRGSGELLFVFRKMNSCTIARPKYGP